MAKKEAKKVENLGHGVGRRKTSVARVYLREGDGKIVINGRTLDSYFGNPMLEFIVKQPLVTTETGDKYDILINVKGGGTSGQAGACRHGIARALVAHDEAYRPALRAAGFMTRDPRMVERQKYGQPGARRKFQFSKR
ncbi:MAG TPA: 30S ribosomal protein S9 [Sphaerochaeta sp.]|jgi:small subunit ribosomal protein S9|nr:30S ribosomal protein S9 [Spirochaetota bacterium]NLV61631.1 30S ribosomal protein S9 [Spirochaetales bacterium]HOE84250.1 30S ribosomal protein S9 [Sphaerochaeta sp.]HOQ94210.1 30S ribosomal protein S9 [Sphaerochaeta sp.]HPK46227.1 30S ribosomal protein S9 [Sphaerochaeta sp.]